MQSPSEIMTHCLKKARRAVVIILIIQMFSSIQMFFPVRRRVRASLSPRCQCVLGLVSRSSFLAFRVVQTLIFRKSLREEKKNGNGTIVIGRGWRDEKEKLLEILLARSKKYLEKIGVHGILFCIDTKLLGYSENTSMGVAFRNIHIKNNLLKWKVVISFISCSSL